VAKHYRDRGRYDLHLRHDPLRRGHRHHRIHLGRAAWYTGAEPWERAVTEFERFLFLLLAAKGFWYSELWQAFLKGLLGR